ncbi:MAG: hypothetical protein WAL24_08955 [Nitrososphaeraceae archaeon]
MGNLTLAVATVLAAGLTVLPGSVQNAQADPYSFENNAGVNAFIDCKFYGPIDIEEAP